MTKLVLAMFTSLDGYIAGPNSEFMPPPWSAEVGEAWANHNLQNAAHLLYGRVNFEFNKGFWTSPAAAAQSESKTMNRLPKTVVSRRLTGEAGWNAEIVSDNLKGAVERLKATVTGGDIYSFGGASLARTLISLNLVDDYYLMITPQLMGCGLRLFDGNLPSVGLQLITARPLDVGSVILHYRRAA